VNLESRVCLVPPRSSNNGTYLSHRDESLGRGRLPELLLSRLPRCLFAGLLLVTTKSGAGGFLSFWGGFLSDTYPDVS
jgi:hypothetical protein